MPNGQKNQRVLLTTFVLTFGAVGVLLWQSRSDPKHTVRQILLDNSTTQEQVAALQQFVQLDDSVTAVAAALDLQENQFSSPPLDRPAYHSIGLDGVNLELALRTDGTVAGIGRHVHGSNSGGTAWLAGHGKNWWESSIQP